MSRLVQNIEGQKFGNLTVINFVGVIKRIGIWKCKCDCGNIKDIRYRDLKSGNSKTCGCSKLYQNTKSHNWKGYEGLPKTIFCIINKNAKKRNLNIDIDIKYIWELYLNQSRKCAISGLDIIFSNKVTERNITTASLDRIDSSKGYIVGNVQWVHKDINKMKMDIPQDEFISYCKIISENYKK
jgi:hypothetical protein